MLLGQQLRGGHEGGLTAVLPGQKGAGGGHHRLARAHVPLQETVHGDGLFQVRRRLPGGAELGVGEGEGQAGGKSLQVLFFKGDSLLLAAAAPEEGQPQVQAEELLEHQTPSGLFQLLPGLGKVDGPVGEVRRGQVVGRPEVVGQGLLNLGHALGGSFLEVPHKFRGDPRRQGVHGHDAPGEGVLARPLEVGVDHLPPAARPGELAVEVIGLPRRQGAADVGLVEEGHVHLGGGVHHPALGQIHALADKGCVEGGSHHGGEAHRLLQGKGLDVLPEGAVLVVPGKVGQQVGHSGKAQLGQGLFLGGPHPLEGGQRGVQGEFGHNRPPFKRIRDISSPWLPLWGSWQREALTERAAQRFWAALTDRMKQNVRQSRPLRLRACGPKDTSPRGGGKMLDIIIIGSVPQIPPVLNVSPGEAARSGPQKRTRPGRRTGRRGRRTWSF